MIQRRWESIIAHMTIEDITHHHGALRSFDLIAVALLGGKTCMEALHSHSSQRGLCDSAITNAPSIGNHYGKRLL